VAVDRTAKKACQSYDEPLMDFIERVPGLDIAVTTLDKLFAWAASNSLWVFPMATSCCGIELMASAAARVDLDRMGTIMRGSPRHCDVMVVAGTITVKMAPRVKKLYDQMPDPKWVLAMGSCAISGDFYRDIYSVVPGIDTFLPVDVYVPGCPPNPEQLMAGLLRLQDKIRAQSDGTWVEPEQRPETPKMIRPDNRRMRDADRDPLLAEAQLQAALNLGLDGFERRVAVPLERTLLAGHVPNHVLRASDPQPFDDGSPASGGAA
jgi:NADH-quinone oxidoreductase subunit B